MKSQNNPIAQITNAVDAEAYTRQMCLEHFGMLNFGLRKIQARKDGRLPEEVAHQAELNATYQANKSEWCRQFFKTNFPKFLNCRIGKILMGETINTVCSGYQPLPF